VKPQVYVDPRPAEYFTRYYERPRSKPPDWIYRLARAVLTIPVLGVYRFRAIGVDNVPYQGPVILAPNHFSFLDHFFIAVLLRRQVQFMAKSQLFRPPFLDFILTHGGAFPVRRGQHDQETFKTAHAILGLGGVVLMYAEGGRSRSRELGSPKSGLGRLILESGVPIVPIAIHGSQHARDVTHGRVPPKVTVQFGEPIAWEQVEHPTRDQSQEVALQVFERVKTMYEALEAQGRRGVLAKLRDAHGQPAHNF
jgi:1-acyl-sn-glycerol-3-phosphate acyltransferase